jgi:hypothetical protein
MAVGSAVKAVSEVGCVGIDNEGGLTDRWDWREGPIIVTFQWNRLLGLKSSVPRPRRTVVPPLRHASTVRPFNDFNDLFHQYAWNSSLPIRSRRRFQPLHASMLPRSRAWLNSCLFLKLNFHILQIVPDSAGLHETHFSNRPTTAVFDASNLKMTS